MSSKQKPQPAKIKPGKALATPAQLKATQKLVRELVVDGPVLIKSAAQYIEVAERLKAIKGATQQVKALRSELIIPIRDHLKKLDALFAEPLQELADAEAAHKAAIAIYDAAQQQLQITEQRKVDAAAEKRRAAIAAKIDAAQTNAKVESRNLRKEASEAAKDGNKALAGQLRERAKAVEAKAGEKIEQLSDKALDIVAPIIQREAPKVEGVSVRERWTFEVLDAAKLDRRFMTPDLEGIGKLVNALRADAAGVLGEGVRVYSVPVVASEAA